MSNYSDKKYWSVKDETGVKSNIRMMIGNADEEHTNSNGIGTYKYLFSKKTFDDVERRVKKLSKMFPELEITASELYDPDYENVFVITVAESKSVLKSILSGKSVRVAVMESVSYLNEEKVCDYNGYSIYHVFISNSDWYEIWKSGKQIGPKQFDTYEDVREYLDDLKESVGYIDESRKFKVGEKFTFTDKYGVNHECTVLAKDLFDEEDYDDYAIGTMTFSYPTMGNPHKETVRIFKSEQRDSYGDEYFVLDTEKLKSGVGIASWSFPN